MTNSESSFPYTCPSCGANSDDDIYVDCDENVARCYACGDGWDLNAPLSKGDRVRPACDGDKVNWSKLRGTVVDVWQDGQEMRAEVRWDRVCGYPTRLPVDLLQKA